VRSVLVAAGLIAGVALGLASPSDASERSVKNASMIQNKSSVPQQRQAADGARYERKCVIMSCGTPWCFNTRVN
jgi:hypothetical protein